MQSGRSGMCWIEPLDRLDIRHNLRDIGSAGDYLQLYRGGCAAAGQHQAGGHALPDPGHHRLAVAVYPLARGRSEEHTSELQSLMRISYAVFCLKKQTNMLYIMLNIHC